MDNVQVKTGMQISRWLVLRRCNWCLHDVDILTARHQGLLQASPGRGMMSTVLLPRDTSLMTLKFRLCLYALVALWLAGCSPGLERGPVTIQGSTMGTTYSVQLHALPEGISRRQLQQRLEDILSAVNSQMSTYDPESEISRFNQSESTDWFPVSAELALLVSIAQGHGLLSHGAFDITIGPLVELWGFGTRITSESPEPDQVNATHLNIGQQLLAWRGSPPALRKRNTRLQVDLSAIAKGYAVDLLSGHLSSLGMDDHLVEIGGELRASGLNAQGQPWQIGVQDPGESAPLADIVIGLSDQSVATSGDYLNFYIENGQRYSHIIDPRTGYPVFHQTAAVTVVAETTTLADAWATTLLVLGEGAGMELAEQHRIAALFLEREGEAFRMAVSSEMIGLLGN